MFHLLITGARAVFLYEIIRWQHLPHCQHPLPFTSIVGHFRLRSLPLWLLYWCCGFWICIVVFVFVLWLLYLSCGFCTCVVAFVFGLTPLGHRNQAMRKIRRVIRVSHHSKITHQMKMFKYNSNTQDFGVWVWMVCLRQHMPEMSTFEIIFSIFSSCLIHVYEEKWRHIKRVTMLHV